MRPRPSHPFPTAALTAVALALTAACASNTNNTPQQPRAAETATPTPSTPTSLDAPMLTGRRAGAEAHWWITSNIDNALTAALAPHATNEQLTGVIPASIRERFRREGLRLIPVPTDDLETLRSSAPPIRQWSRSWIEPGRDWNELVAGRRISSTQRLIINDRPASPGAGTLRLLIRTRVEPVPPGDAALRIDLAVQLEEPREESTFTLQAPDRLPAETERGPLFTHLNASFTLPPNTALAIAPAHPTEDWSDPTTSTTQTTTTPTDTPTDSPPDASADQSPTTPFGPATPELPTIGKAMLAGTDKSQQPAAVIALVIPRLPQSFNLLPDP